MTGRRRIVWIVAIAALGSGCIESTGPGFQRGRVQAVGVLQFEAPGSAGVPVWAESASNAPVLTWTRDPEGALVAPRAVFAPAEVQAGIPFEVRVFTIGRSGCWKPEGHVVHLTAGVVEITPYDAHSGADICTAVLSYLRHTVTLRLHEPGEWIVRVAGRRARHGDPLWETPVTAETTVTVR